VLDRRIESFINTYRAERDEFTTNEYVGKSRWYRMFYVSYSDWTSFGILDGENTFNTNMVSKVKNTDILKESLSITVLSLKNRTEYLSDQVDFFTAFITWVILALSFMVVVLKNHIPSCDASTCSIEEISFLIPCISFLFLVIIGVFTCEKWQLRKEISTNKEIINIFEKCISENTK